MDEIWEIMRDRDIFVVYTLKEGNKFADYLANYAS